MKAYRHDPGDAIKVPEVSFSCLSSGASYVPPSPGSPPPMTTTTTSSSSSPTPSPTKTSISSNSAFYGDFSGGSMAQWTTYGGSFAASSGALVGSNSIGGKALINSNYGNFLYEVDMTLPPTSGNADLIFRVTNPSDGADVYNVYFCSASVDLAINQAHHVKAEVVDTVLSDFVDDMSHALFSVTDGTYTSGMNGDIISKIFSAIQIHAAARESDLAQSINAEFVRFREGKGFTAVLTDPIEKPPLPTHQEWDTNTTISKNQGKDGFNAEFEQQVRNFVQVTTSTSELL
ncbi:hypothetical protein ZTR_09969 [Talaromyces verruculosus]|nr:hypothetical protein ZTR_09969 [Talaromyces verruculosus]